MDDENCGVEVYADEPQLLAAFARLMTALDPDIVVGFDLQKASMGYLVDRAAQLETSEEGGLLRAVSRTPEEGSIREGQVRAPGERGGGGGGGGGCLGLTELI